MGININGTSITANDLQEFGLGNIVTDGLVLYLDSAQKHSYPAGGNTWYDLSGNSNNYTLGDNITFDTKSVDISSDTFDLSDNGGAGGGALNTSTLTTSSSCTLVLWIKTTDDQALFWGADPDSGYSGGYYVGAYRIANKEYYGTCGTPDYYQDLVQKSNIYDNIRDGLWHMVEFKNVDFSVWTNEHNFNSYGSYTFNNGSVGLILLYNKNLSASESLQNYNATKARYEI